MRKLYEWRCRCGVKSWRTQSAPRTGMRGLLVRVPACGTCKRPMQATGMEAVVPTMRDARRLM